MSRKQNKPATLILATIVLGIWGIFVYRIYNKSEGKSILQNREIQLDEIRNPEKRKAYTVAPYTRDPFLGKREQKTVKKKQPKPTLPKVKWPKINYLGALTSTKGKRHLVRVDKKTVVWEVDKEYNGIRLEQRGKKLFIKKEGQTKTLVTQSREK